jgi:hypothetical protein
VVRAFLFWFKHERSQKIHYLLAEKIAYKISKAGYGVVHGGPWHYGNKGAAVELQWD